MIDEARVTVHCDVPVRGDRYVLYWMQASVRTRANHALEFAVQVANDVQLPLIVCFGLDADYADATARTIRFLADGLVDVCGWSRPLQHRLRSSDLVYTAAQLESAGTADASWNAAMVELRETGYVHNGMRMYWGKRILDWTNTPTYPYGVALDLNNRYFLEGRDPNSYANVGWIFSLHHQAIAEREITGKVRPMTRSGLEHKIDTGAYVRHVEEITGSAIAGDS